YLQAFGNRGKAAAGHGAIQSRSGGALCADAGYFRTSSVSAAEHRWRDSVDRRARGDAQPGAGTRLSLLRYALQLREQARLREGDRAVRVATSRGTRGFRG